MSIINSIETARKAKVNDDAILSEIVKQNPAKATVFEQARKRGASASDIINEVINQNKGLEKPSIIEQNLNNKVTSPQPAEEKKDSLLGKVGKFFTGATQKFAETLGTAASVIDPVTQKNREDTLASSQKQADNYLQMAKNETDKTKKDQLLKAASYLADTSGIDIYNNPEYQKTAKQIYGEGIGVAAETLGWGKVGNIAKTVKAATVGQTVLKAAGSGAILSGVTSTANAMSENKSTDDILKSGAIGTATGAVLGGATGYVAGKLFGKLGEKKATQLVSERLSDKGKIIAYKTGRASEAGLLKSEKITSTKAEQELGKVAQDIGLMGKNKVKDISRVEKAISTEAEALKKTLKDSGAIYNKNNIKGSLNKMKEDKTIDLIDSEVVVYDKMIGKFNKMVENKNNKRLDGLLELRQDFDAWAKSNSPTIFENRRGGAYRALTSVRDNINSYINNKIPDNVVKQSLNKQTSLYKIWENLSEKAVRGGTKLKSSVAKNITKKLLPYAVASAGGAIGINAINKAVSSSSNSTPNYYQGQ